jgi:hypothetical protein
MSSMTDAARSLIIRNNSSTAFNLMYLLKLFPHPGNCDPSGVYAIAQSDCFNFGSLMNVDGSFGSVCFTGPFPWSLEVELPLEEEMPLLEEPFLERLTPAATPTMMIARRAMPPMICASWSWSDPSPTQGFKGFKGQLTSHFRLEDFFRGSVGNRL